MDKGLCGLVYYRGDDYDLSKEIWMPVKEFPKYEVNQFGDIRNKRTLHIKKPREDNWGYHQVGLNNGVHGKTYSKTVHRIVADAFFDGEHSNLQVNHIDGNKQNNFIGNLEFVTASENVKHAYDSGIRKPSGGRGLIRNIRIIETGQVFDNMAECAKFVKGDSGNISRCVNNPTRTYKGYHYEAI